MVTPDIFYQLEVRSCTATGVAHEAFGGLGTLQTQDQSLWPNGRRDTSSDNCRGAAGRLSGTAVRVIAFLQGFIAPLIRQQYLDRAS